MSDLMYLNGYPEQLLQQVRQLIHKQQLGDFCETLSGSA